MENGELERSETSAARDGVSRRALLAGGVVAGGIAWAAPAVIGTAQFVAGAASTPPPNVIVGGAVVTVHGNNFKSIPAPTGTSSIYLLVLSVDPDDANDLESYAFGSGNTTWTKIVTPQILTPGTPATSTAHQLFVFWSTTAANTTVQMQASNNDYWSGQIFGISSGTTAAGGTPVVSTTGASITVTSPAVVNSSTSYVLIGGANVGTGTTNWSVPTGFTSKSDVSGNPDISLSQYNTVGTSPGSQTVSFGGSGAATAVMVSIT